MQIPSVTTDALRFSFPFHKLRRLFPQASPGTCTEICSFYHPKSSESSCVSPLPPPSFFLPPCSPFPCFSSFSTSPSLPSSISVLASFLSTFTFLCFVFDSKSVSCFSVSVVSGPLFATSVLLFSFAVFCLVSCHQPNLFLFVLFLFYLLPRWQCLATLIMFYQVTAFIIYYCISSFYWLTWFSVSLFEFLDVFPPFLHSLLPVFPGILRSGDSH